MDYRDEVIAAARESATEVDPHALAHRGLMERVKLLVGLAILDLAPAASAAPFLDALERRQLRSGLFAGGDNVESPPDSAFTAGDVCDALEIIRRHPSAALDPIGARLELIADHLEPPLLVGGVHTPNHRWEISAALARLHRRRPSGALVDRIDAWLAEGVDIDADGMYSERSPNYAAFVTNPSLTVIAEILGRPDLDAIVQRNLAATLPLIRADGTVETVHSRRQDQGRRFSAAAYITAFRRAALRTGDGRFAWAAEVARSEGIAHPATALAELLLEPQLAQPLPRAVAPVSAVHRYAASSLVVDRSEVRTLVVYGGSDHARAGRIRSGLANDPTFLRLLGDDVALESVRLSRTFFGLGPFRAQRLDGMRLQETVAAWYYQPLGSAGALDLEDEGRFSAEMSFSRRAADRVEMTTTIDVEPTTTGARVVIDVAGPIAPWALELAFSPGGAFEGLADDGRFGSAAVRYQHGGQAIVFRADGESAADAPAAYHPGEEYAYLGGSDAVAAPRAYLTGWSPGRRVVELRVE
ncbi:hypothetical protein [Microbacterium gilvum]|uniref:Uncharacterized protein n=1 Tax=Microbacterium gilvum TaxID=1336204 RepID=A0ABP8ZZZ6_9MICO